MNARIQEDNPPCVRRYRDVIDEAHAIIAAERARKWRLAIRYHVDHGYQGAHTQHFVEFAPALAFYIDHLSDGAGPFAPVIKGYAFDGTSDGLTDEEREVVDLAKAGM
jgi:hypothetical protein